MKCISPILALMIFVICSIETSFGRPIQTKSSTTSFNVDTRIGPTWAGSGIGNYATGISVHKGDHIVIVASGSFNNGIATIPSPDGVPELPNPQYGLTIMPDRASNALVGGISVTSGQYFVKLLDGGGNGMYGPGFVGSYFNGIAQDSGEIFLAINDTPLNDNVGFLNVEITVSAPVIESADNFPAPGFSTPVSFTTPTSGLGNAGANQTWDFRSLVFTPMATLEVLNPAASLFASSYPTSNFVYSLNNTYSYFIYSSEKLELVASNITSPGLGKDFSPNPITMIKFPFHFGDTLTDTWQTVGGSAGTVTVTYDGYGTLHTPNATYHNVVRLKGTFIDGSDYRWMLLNPFWSILMYDHVVNVLFLSEAPSTGIQNKQKMFPGQYLLNQNYPNPFNPSTIIGYQLATRAFVTLRVYDNLGREVAILVNGTQSAGTYSVVFKAGNLPSGMYFYRLQAGTVSETKKLMLLK